MPITQNQKIATNIMFNAWQALKSSVAKTVKSPTTTAVFKNACRQETDVLLTKTKKINKKLIKGKRASMLFP